MIKPLRIIYLSLVLLVVSASVALAQTGTIRGFVYDKKGGEPVIFTNVYLKGTTYGASTDVNGHYVISQVPVGDYTLTVTYLGYDTLILPVSVQAGKIVSKLLNIQKSQIQLGVVEISAEIA